MLSRLSAKSQITIPKRAREAIGAGPGDLVIFELADGVLILRKAEPFDAAFHGAVSETLDEWNSPEDEEAFRDL